MAASRSDHHRRQTEDYNEVPVISCDYGFLLQIAEMMRKDNSLKQRQWLWKRHQYSCFGTREAKWFMQTLCVAKELKINFQ